MSTDVATPRQSTESSLWYSIRRGVITQYWPFTAYVLAYATFGYALGASVTGFDPLIYGGILAALWFGLEGLHAVDLSDEGVALRTHNGVSKYLGYAQVGVGGIIGLWLASQTSWLFIVFIGAAMIFGLAYNEEWFDGLLHDDDKLTGLFNFGFAWGVIPVFGAYFLATQTVTLGIVLVSIGVMLDAIRVILLFESGKPAPYEDLDILYNRDYDDNLGMVREVTHQSNKISMAAWAFIALGVLVLFVI